MIDPAYRPAAFRSLEEMEKEAIRIEERADRKFGLTGTGVHDEEFLKLEIIIWRSHAKRIREHAEALRKKIDE